MKKVYSKPEIVFENFSLTTSIAGDCDVKTATWGMNNEDCAMDFSGIPVFLSGMNICETGIAVENMGGDGDFNGICYHVPVDSNNLFNS